MADHSSYAPVVVFYDLDKISSRDFIQVANEFVDGDTIHVLRSDVIWPDKQSFSIQSLKLEEIDDDRSAIYRNALMNTMDDNIRFIRNNKIASWMTTYRGVDLLEIARYEWFYATSRLTHLNWVASQFNKDIFTGKTGRGSRIECP